MTLEQICGMNADELEKFMSKTDAELEEHFRPFFPTTRPEQVKMNRPVSNTSHSGTKTIQLSAAKQEAFKMLGLDPSLLRMKKRR